MGTKLTEQERKARLRQIAIWHLEGKGMREIGVLLGGLTKNAVVGTIDRNRHAFNKLVATLQPPSPPSDEIAALDRLTAAGHFRLAALHANMDRVLAEGKALMKAGRYYQTLTGKPFTPDGKGPQTIALEL